MPLDVNSLLSSEEIVAQLTPHLPEDSELIRNSKSELKTTLSSPQLRQSLSSFSLAFSSGQLAPLMSQFDLSEDAVTAANKGDMKAFVEALNKAAAGDKKTDNGDTSKESKDKEKTDDGGEDGVSEGDQMDTR